MFQRLIAQLQYRKVMQDLSTNISYTELMCEQLAKSCEDEIPDQFDEIVKTIRRGASAWEDTFRIVACKIVDLDPVLHRRGWEALQKLEDLERLRGEA